MGQRRLYACWLGNCTWGWVGTGASHGKLLAWSGAGNEVATAGTPADKRCLFVEQRSSQNALSFLDPFDLRPHPAACQPDCEGRRRGGGGGLGCT